MANDCDRYGTRMRRTLWDCVPVDGNSPTKKNRDDFAEVESHINNFDDELVATGVLPRIEDEQPTMFDLRGMEMSAL